MKVEEREIVRLMQAAGLILLGEAYRCSTQDIMDEVKPYRIAEAKSIIEKAELLLKYRKEKER